jgi:hypothetical protein
MRISLPSFAALAALTLASALQGPAPAAAAPIYAWCMQPSGRWGPDCYYTTAEQCRATALGVGFCYQNPAYTVATQGKPDRRQR